MNRIIRITRCDECPNAAWTVACRRTVVRDAEGIHRMREFDSFPLIPDWCPLEIETPAQPKAGPVSGSWPPPGVPPARRTRMFPGECHP